MKLARLSYGFCNVGKRSKGTGTVLNAFFLHHYSKSIYPPDINPKLQSAQKNNYIIQLNNDKPILICTGPTGTGKTFLACREGVLQLQNGKYKKIIITRPSVGIEDEDHGFLPGRLSSKMDPWMEPIYQNISEIFGSKVMNNIIKNELLEIVPLMYLRGRTFNDSFVIADEMQNSTPTQFKTLLTRSGVNSKLVITGDHLQSDIQQTNGLIDFIKCFLDYNRSIGNYHDLETNIPNVDSPFIDFTILRNEDIIRSDIVAEILKIYSVKNVEINKNVNLNSPW